MDTAYVISLAVLIAIIFAVLVLLVWIHFRSVNYLDRVLRSPIKQVLGLCVLLLLLFIFLKSLHAVFFTDSDFSGYALYGILSQTSSIEVSEADDGLKFYTFLVSILGAVFFSGIWVSTITNSLLRRIREVEDGKVRYSSLRNHDVIIGVDDTLVSAIKSFCGKGQIVVVTGKACPEVSEIIQSQLDASLSKRIILYKESILDNIFIAKLCLEHARCLILLGDDMISDRKDAENAVVIDWIQKFLEKHPLRRTPLKCYVSYVSEDILLNLCRNLRTDILHLIPYNFYRLWAENMWGYGQLYKCLSDNIYPERRRMRDADDAYRYEPLLARKAGTTLHLVLVGFGKVAEELLKAAIRLAHYADFDESTGIGKTRITVFPSSLSCGGMFYEDAVARFLMKYRIADLVDIEVVFEKDTMFSKGCIDKMEFYLTDSNQSLYLAICSDNAYDNISFSNHLPCLISKENIPVVVYSDYFMPFMEPLNNQGVPQGNVLFFGFKNKFLNVKSLFQMAQAYDYLLGGKGIDNALYLSDKVDSYWFRTQYDLPKLVLLATVNSWFNVIYSWGYRICKCENAWANLPDEDLDLFIRTLHRVHLASYVLGGYRYSSQHTDYKMKELSFLCALTDIADELEKDEQEAKLKKRYEAMRKWLYLNKWGLIGKSVS